MAKLLLKTNLRCGACVESVRPLLDAMPGVASWSADMESPDKTLAVHGEGLSVAAVDERLRQKGYQVLGTLPAATPELIALGGVAPRAESTPAGPATSYFPLFLIVGYLLGVVLLVEFAAGEFSPMRAMNHFMAGFFLVFSFFKMLDLGSFATAFAGYDLLAARSRLYGLAYPFIELTLGAAYLSGVWPVATNVATLLVMGVSTVGVVQSLLARRKIRCACLGSVFNLPMSTVTLVEDLLMVAMSAGMLVALLAHG